MFVVTVVPLSRGTNATGLTYYTATKCTIGTIVRAPIRGREISALVIDSEPVSHTKTALKAATFTLRNLPADPIIGHIPTSLIELTQTLYTHYPATIGALLFALLPTEVRNGTFTYADQTAKKQANTQTQSEESQVLIATTTERYTRYQSQIRTTFAHGGSTLLVVPSAAEVYTAHQILSVGIQSRVICISPHQSTIKRREAWKSAHTTSQSVLIITTPSYAYIERHDTTHLIIERAGNTRYRSRSRPYIDHTLALQLLAKGSGYSCVIGDTLLRSEAEFARRNEVLPSVLEPPKRLMLTSRLTVCKEPEDRPTDKSFRYFFPDTLAQLSTALHERNTIFLYAARRGIAPIIACLDCGALARCHESGNPYSLLRTHRNGAEKRWFVDTASGRRVRAADTCDQCGSWRLRERGIGIQQIEDVLPEYFPDTPIITFDATTARTPKKALTLQRQMEKAKGTIILGTAMALPYLPNHISHTCVTSLEAAASIPSWRADELLFRLLLDLREKTEQTVLLQARHEPTPIVNLAKQGMVEQFYDEELKLREQLHYPPFTVLILLTWTGSTEVVTKQTELIEQHLPQETVHYYNHPYSHQAKVTRYGLLRIPRERWPEKALLKRLRELPPSIKIQVDPDQII